MSRFDSLLICYLSKLKTIETKMVVDVSEIKRLPKFASILASPLPSVAILIYLQAYF